MKKLLIVVFLAIFSVLGQASEPSCDVEDTLLQKKSDDKMENKRSHRPDYRFLTRVSYKDDIDQAYYDYAIPELIRLTQIEFNKVYLPPMVVRAHFYIDRSGLVEKVELSSLDRKDYEKEVLSQLSKISAQLKETDLKGNCSKYVIIVTLAYEKNLRSSD